MKIYTLEFKDGDKKWDRWSYDNDLNVMEKRFTYAESHRPPDRRIRLTDGQGVILKETVVA